MKEIKMRLSFFEIISRECSNNTLEDVLNYKYLSEVVLTKKRLDKKDIKSVYKLSKTSRSKVFKIDLFFSCEIRCTNRYHFSLRTFNRTILFLSYDLLELLEFLEYTLNIIKKGRYSNFSYEYSRITKKPIIVFYGPNVSGKIIQLDKQHVKSYQNDYVDNARLKMIIPF